MTWLFVTNIKKLSYLNSRRDPSFKLYKPDSKVCLIQLQLGKLIKNLSGPKLNFIGLRWYTIGPLSYKIKFVSNSIHKVFFFFFLCGSVSEEASCLLGSHGGLIMPTVMAVSGRFSPAILSIGSRLPSFKSPARRRAAVFVPVSARASSASLSIETNSSVRLLRCFWEPILMILGS